MVLPNMYADDIQNLEPQRTNNGFIKFDNLPAAAAPIELAVVAFPLPAQGNGTIMVPHLNEDRKYAGKPTFENITLQIIDFVQNDVAGAVFAWRRQVYNPLNGKIGFAVNYKKTATLYTVGPNGLWQRSWKLIGVWPSAFDPGAIDMNADGDVRISLVLEVDKAIPVITTVNNGQSTNTD